MDSFLEKPRMSGYYFWPLYLSSLYNWHFLREVAITLIRV